MLENCLWNPFHTLVQNNRSLFCGELWIPVHADLSGWNQNVEPVPYFSKIVASMWKNVNLFVYHRAKIVEMHNLHTE